MSCLATCCCWDLSCSSRSSVADLSWLTGLNGLRCKFLPSSPGKSTRNIKLRAEASATVISKENLIIIHQSATYMDRSAVPSSKVGDITSAADETVQFDDDTLGVAEVYKNEGNDEYNRKNFHSAINIYTEGIKVNCKDKELNAKLYSNRAAAHFNLGNYTEALNDATMAINLLPSFLKAFVRGASACVQLKKFNEAISWCDKGLAIDQSNQKLLELQKRSLREQKKLYDDFGKEGKSASEALNLAMNCMRESEEFSAVKYWAPFELIGDDVTLELSECE
ncbi:Tetratricopeptide repeat protein 4 [Porites harrisoni]